MNRFRVCLVPAGTLLLTLTLVGCAGFGGFSGFRSSGNVPETAPVEPEVTPELPASVRPSQVIGRWGYASFRRPEDRGPH